jgi:hypothetical protein
MARSSDIDSIDAIIHAMYEVISGPADEARDWERFRSLYYPGARLVPVVAAEGQTARARVLSPEEYIRRVEPIFATESFYERETRREGETIGRVAHVLSYYESFHEPDGAPFDAGVNSVQLVHDGSRWWILSVVWNSPRKE